MRSIVQWARSVRVSIARARCSLDDCAPMDGWDLLRSTLTRGGVWHEKCHEFEAIIISMARRQLVEVAARETALAHLDRCARCADAFEEQRAMTAGIRVAAESLANQGPSPRVEEALRRAFRERAGRLAERRITPQPAENGRWSRRVIGAAAAAILFLALLAGANWLKSPPANQKQEATNLPATPSVSAPGRKQESQARAVRRRNQNQKTASG